MGLIQGSVLEFITDDMRKLLKGSENEMSFVKYKMTGLTCEGCTCGHCGQPILIYLKCMDGVLSVSPNFKEDTVVIEYDQEVVTPKVIEKLIQNRGYSLDET